MKVTPEIKKACEILTKAVHHKHVELLREVPGPPLLIRILGREKVTQLENVISFLETDWNV